jgi:hypothetical protein
MALVTQSPDPEVFRWQIDFLNRVKDSLDEFIALHSPDSEVK